MAEGQTAEAEDSADIVAKLKLRMIDHALPLWSTEGWDATTGGFIDRLHPDGQFSTPNARIKLKHLYPAI
jgi:mannose/cellobiose epimerase-like protein (N-acyl-D-glucosamine 2-epimerase family)